MAPGLPIASVPTGTPPGICTMESSESIPFSAADSMGTPSTGRQVLLAARDHDLQAARLRGAGVLDEPVRRAMRGNDIHLVGDPE